MPLPNWLPFSSERTDIPKAAGIEVKCPKCGHRKMLEIFSRSVSRTSDDKTGLECPACHYQAFSQPKAPESKTSILPVAGRFEGQKPKIEPDETVRADKKPLWDRLGIAKSRPVPTKYFCPTCCKTRAFIVDLAGKTRCPQCKCQFDVSELETGA